MSPSSPKKKSNGNLETSNPSSTSNPTTCPKRPVKKHKGGESVETHPVHVKITESRKELFEKLTRPHEYLDDCPFCGRKNGDHSHDEMVVCVAKKFVAQGILPEYFEGDLPW